MRRGDAAGAIPIMRAGYAVNAGRRLGATTRRFALAALTVWLMGVATASVRAQEIHGDANCDGRIDATDKQIFTDILSQGPANFAVRKYSSCDLRLLDTNRDGGITVADSSIYP